MFFFLKNDNTLTLIYVLELNRSLWSFGSDFGTIFGDFKRRKVLSKLKVALNSKFSCFVKTKNLQENRVSK